MEDGQQSLPKSGEAWRSLLARVESAVGRLLGHGPDCDDVVQNSFVRLLRASRRGVPIQCLEAWLVRVSWREVAKWQRSQRRSLPLCPGGAEQEVACRDGSPAAIAWDILLERACAVLPAGMVPWLVDLLDGLEDAEVAVRDGVSEAAVRKRWSRLRARLEDRKIVARILDGSVTIEALRDLARHGANDDPVVPRSNQVTQPSPMLGVLKVSASALFVGAAAFSLSSSLRSTPTCDMMVRQLGASISWQCSVGPCDQCSVAGTCQNADVTVNDGGPTFRRCKCRDAGGNQAADTCSVEIRQDERSTSVYCVNGGLHCECHEVDMFYLGQIPGCNPGILTLPETYEFVCNCTGKEDRDNHP